MAERKLQRNIGLAVAAAAFLALPATAAAQETQQADTSRARDTSRMGAAQMDTAAQDTSRWGYETGQQDTTTVQNPPGYRGMERPVNVFPPDTGQGQQQDPSAGRVEDKVTGTYDDSAWRDTTGQQQNPAGYRGMERPAGLDTAAQRGRTGQAGQRGDSQQELEQYRQRLGEMGYKIEKMSKSEDTQQELEQYRQRLGEMGYKIEKMSKSEKKAWKEKHGSGTTDTRGQRQSGTEMQRESGTETQRQETTTGRDTTRVGETTPKVPADSARRLPAARGDTTGQSGTSDQQSGTGATGTTSTDTTNQ